MSTCSIGNQTIEGTRDARRVARAKALTLAYWTVWVSAGAYVLQWSHLTVLSVWWLVLAALWLTADLVRPSEELAGPSRRLALLWATVTASLLIYWSADWFLSLVSGVQLGGNDTWTFTSFALQGFLAACLTSLVVVPPLQRALGTASLPALSVASAIAASRLFGHRLFSLRPWMQHPKGIAVALFELLALLLIPPALAALRQRTRNSKPPASHLLARLWRCELPPRVVILSVYPLTLALMPLAIVGSFWKPGDHIPHWQWNYLSAVAWISTWILILTGSVITLRALHRARSRRPWGAASGQLCVILLSGYFLNVTLHSYALTAGFVFLESTASFLGQPYRFRLSADGRELTLSGSIDPGLTDALAESLSRHPTVQRIRLNSATFLRRVAQVPPKSMWYPTRAELINAHVL